MKIWFQYSQSKKIKDSIQTIHKIQLQYSSTPSQFRFGSMVTDEQMNNYVKLQNYRSHKYIINFIVMKSAFAFFILTWRIWSLGRIGSDTRLKHLLESLGNISQLDEVLHGRKGPIVKPPKWDIPEPRHPMRQPSCWTCWGRISQGHNICYSLVEFATEEPEKDR